MSTDSVLRYRVFFPEVDGPLLFLKHRKAVSFKVIMYRMEEERCCCAYGSVKMLGVVSYYKASAESGNPVNI